MSSVSAPSGGGSATAAPPPPPPAASSGGSGGSSVGGSSGGNSASGTFAVQGQTQNGSFSMQGSFTKNGDGGLGNSDFINKNSVDPHNADAFKNNQTSSGNKPVADQFYDELCKALGVDPSESSGSAGDGSGAGQNGDNGNISDQLRNLFGGGNNGSGGSGGSGSGDAPRGAGDVGSSGHGGGSHGSTGSHGSHRSHGSHGSHNGDSQSSNGSTGSGGPGDAGKSNDYGPSKPSKPDDSGRFKGNAKVERYENTGSAPSKRQVNAALDAVGASNKNKALIMAMGMQEDHNFKARDTKKDGQGDAANYSAFNLNGYELRQMGYKGDPKRLNDPKNLGEVAQLINKNLEDPNMGYERLAKITRGGQSADHAGSSANINAWTNAQRSSANRMLDDLDRGEDVFNNATRYVSSQAYQ